MNLACPGLLDQSARDRLARILAQSELDRLPPLELVSRVARCLLARPCVERGAQRQRAVPGVLEAVAFDEPGRQQQHGVETIERLDHSLFVHREDGRVRGRLDVQASRIPGLPFEAGIVRLLLALEAMAADPRVARLPGVEIARFHRHRGHARGVAPVPPEALEAIGEDTGAPTIDEVAVAGHRRPEG